MLALLCSLANLAISLFQQRAALISLHLLAVIQIPLPEHVSFSQRFIFDSHLLPKYPFLQKHLKNRIYDIRK